MHVTPAIVATGLRKSFGEAVVLDGVDLTVAEGTIFALLGPNGAGKTTMVRILSTLIRADSGAVSVAGHDVADDPDGVRASIGVTGQFSAVDDLLTGAENLRLMADLNHLGRAAGRARVAELLERFDLVDAAGRPVSTYSGGMRRRLDLAMTLVGSPRVIFLDEPTTGLDPRSRRTMWDGIRELAASGVTIFLTTQYLDEADELADRIAVLDRGRIVAEGTPGRAQAAHPRRPRRLQFTEPRRPARSRRAVRRRRAERGAGSSSTCRATAASHRCDACSSSSTTAGSTSSSSRSTAPTWTTCSSRSPGTPPTRRRPPDEQPRLHRQRLGDDAAPQPAAPACATRR